MDTPKRFRPGDLPLVLCVGTSPDDLTAVLTATAGRIPVLYLPDATGLNAMFIERPANPRLLEYGELRVDTGLREATWHSKPIRLSARDFDLLYTLTKAEGQVSTFAELTRQVWGREYIGDTEAVVSAVKRLRRQLRAATSGVRVASVRGIGYRLDLMDNTDPLVE